MKDANNIVLKSCPFCNSNETKITQHFGFMESTEQHGIGFVVSCEKCWIKSRLFLQQSDAVDFWNKRTSSEIINDYESSGLFRSNC
jgi:hypothetical protein